MELPPPNELCKTFSADHGTSDEFKASGMGPLVSIRGISKQAVGVIRGLLRSVEFEDGLRDPVTFVYPSGRVHEVTQLAADSADRVSPPTLGFSSRDEVASDEIEVVDSLEIVFQFTAEERRALADTVLDFQEGRFVFLTNCGEAVDGPR